MMSNMPVNECFLAVVCRSPSCVTARWPNLLKRWRACSSMSGEKSTAMPLALGKASSSVPSKMPSPAPRSRTRSACGRQCRSTWSITSSCRGRSGIISDRSVRKAFATSRSFQISAGISDSFLEVSLASVPGSTQFPALAVLLTHQRRGGRIGELHGGGIPGECLAGETHGDVAEQHGFGQPGRDVEVRCCHLRLAGPDRLHPFLFLVWILGMVTHAEGSLFGLVGLDAGELLLRREAELRAVVIGAEQHAFGANQERAAVGGRFAGPKYSGEHLGGRQHAGAVTRAF